MEPTIFCVVVPLVFNICSLPIDYNPYQHIRHERSILLNLGNTSEGKIINTAQLDKQLIINIEPKVIPQFNVYLDSLQQSPRMQCTTEDEEDNIKPRKQTFTCMSLSSFCCPSTINCICSEKNQPYTPPTHIYYTTPEPTMSTLQSRNCMELCQKCLPLRIDSTDKSPDCTELCKKCIPPKNNCKELCRKCISPPDPPTPSTPNCKELCRKCPPPKYNCKELCRKCVSPPVPPTVSTPNCKELCRKCPPPKNNCKELCRKCTPPPDPPTPSTPNCKELCRKCPPPNDNCKELCRKCVSPPVPPTFSTPNCKELCRKCLPPKNNCKELCRKCMPPPVSSTPSTPNCNELCGRCKIPLRVQDNCMKNCERKCYKEEKPQIPNSKNCEEQCNQCKGFQPIQNQPHNPNCISCDLLCRMCSNTPKPHYRNKRQNYIIPKNEEPLNTTLGSYNRDVHSSKQLNNFLPSSEMCQMLSKKCQQNGGFSSPCPPSIPLSPAICKEFCNKCKHWKHDQSKQKLIPKSEKCKYLCQDCSYQSISLPHLTPDSINCTGLCQRCVNFQKDIIPGSVQCVHFCIICKRNPFPVSSPQTISIYCIEVCKQCETKRVKPKIPYTDSKECDNLCNKCKKLPHDDPKSKLLYPNAHKCKMLCKQCIFTIQTKALKIHRKNCTHNNKYFFNLG